jgi:hypothetical protein
MFADFQTIANAKAEAKATEIAEREDAVRALNERAGLNEETRKAILTSFRRRVETEIEVTVETVDGAINEIIALDAVGRIHRETHWG